MRILLSFLFLTLSATAGNELSYYSLFNSKEIFNRTLFMSKENLDTDMVMHTYMVVHEPEAIPLRQPRVEKFSQRMPKSSSLYKRVLLSSVKPLEVGYHGEQPLRFV